jgi:hypothetical protein
MKKKILWAVIITALISCNENPLSPNVKSDCVNPMNNSSSVFHGLRNSDDTEDDRMNECLYYMGAGIVHLMQNPTHREKFLDKTRYNAKGEGLVDDFFEGDDGMLNDFNKFLAANKDCFTYEFSNYSELKSLMSYQEVSYEPCVYFYNIQDAVTGEDEMSQYTVGIGESVTANDEIPAYRVVLGESSTTETLVAESNQESASPILIITNYTEAYIETTDDIVLEENPDRTYIVDQHRIAFDYEGSGANDYHGSYRVRYGIGISADTKSGHHINSISDAQVGVTFTNPVVLTELSWPVEEIGYWFVAHERDWYASRKNVWVAATNGAPQGLNVECAMKYNHEFYQRVYLNFVNMATVTSNEKGLLRVTIQ